MPRTRDETSACTNHRACRWRQEGSARLLLRAVGSDRAVAGPRARHGNGGLAGVRLRLRLLRHHSDRPHDRNCFWGGTGLRVLLVDRPAWRGIRARAGPRASSLAANDWFRAEVRSAERPLLQCRHSGTLEQAAPHGRLQKPLRSSRRYRGQTKAGRNPMETGSLLLVTRGAAWCRRPSGRRPRGRTGPKYDQSGVLEPQLCMRLVS